MYLLYVLTPFPKALGESVYLCGKGRGLLVPRSIMMLRSLYLLGDYQVKAPRPDHNLECRAFLVNHQGSGGV